MAFKAGKSGNPAGKPKGTKNKTTKELKALVTDFVAANWSRVQKDFDDKKLLARDRLAFMDRLLRYSVPTMTSAKSVLDIKSDLEKLSPQQLDQIIEHLAQVQAEDDDQESEAED